LPIFGLFTISSRLNFHATNRYVRIFCEQMELPLKARKVGVHVLWNPGYTAPIFTPCPQVLSILDMQYRRHPEDLTPIARIATDLLIKRTQQKVRQFITISRFSKSEIIHFTSIPHDKIHVTPLAVEDVDQNNKTRVELLELVSKWLEPDVPYLLTIANSYPHKNIHTLVEAFERIEKQIPHRLVIVGKPRLGEGRLIESLSKISDPKRVVRIYGLSRPALFSLYRCAALFVFPSLYEGFGLPILEAMISETPVVTTKMASIPEVGGNCAVYVDKPTAEAFAEKILQVLGWDPAYRSSFLSEAKKWAKTFSWKRTAEKTVEILIQAADFKMRKPPWADQKSQAAQ